MTRLKGIALPAAVLLLVPAASAQVSFLSASNYDTGVGLDLAPGTTDIAAADFDEDGDLDLVVTNRDDATIQLLFNSGLGIFAPGATIDVDDFSGMTDTQQRQERPTRRPYALAVADFDGDDNLDVAVAVLGMDQVVVFLGNGDGTFAAGAAYAVGDGPQSIAAGDLDGASGPDLVTGNTNDESVSVLLNNGDGTFTAGADISVEVELSTSAIPRGVAIGAFDAGTVPDIAVTIFTRDEVVILFGDGTGEFPFFDTAVTGVNPLAIAAADVDGTDGLDLVVGNSNTDDVTVLLNDGDAHYASAGDFAAGNRVEAVIVADVDGDGSLDVATANSQGSNASVLTGDGTGTFAAPVMFSTGGGPTGIAAGDFNADGDLDLATANQVGGNVSVLLAGTGIIPPTLPQCGVACGPLGLAPMLLTLVGLIGLKQYRHHYGWH